MMQMLGRTARREANKQGQRTTIQYTIYGIHQSLSLRNSESVIVLIQLDYTQAKACEQHYVINKRTIELEE